MIVSVSRRTVYRWMKRNKDFRTEMERIKALRIVECLQKLRMGTASWSSLHWLRRTVKQPFFTDIDITPPSDDEMEFDYSKT